ncbi:hypothetical protein [Leucothrix pacifica]|uniref:Uncharacterized protein n=1 Tax=Leucothrix pacifica TaxID=1247513 RepID=A0A317C1V0_9GAMM|nr:hypothetical protein [Leucothrix pacifica]PWQ92339.1 hypothetical protein DKW60_21580 [Leucothrix pacifica]
MFVYVLKICGLPRDGDALKLFETTLGTPPRDTNNPLQIGDEITVANPHRNGELFFEDELKALGQSFTALSRAGIQFEVLRKRYNGEYKLVADYTAFLKAGRKEWRDEKLRVDAASESLESFLCQEASSEDMEVLRPLFPADVNKLLRDTETGVMKGSEMLQTVFPSIKGADARRIFYQMQLLFERRSGKWKNRLGCAWVSIYFIMAVLIGFAIYDWLTETIDLHGLIAAPLAFVLGLVPFLSSILAYISATSLWEWNGIGAFVVFFWYYFPIVILIVMLLAAAFRGDAKRTWEGFMGKNKLEDGKGPDKDDD